MSSLGALDSQSALYGESSRYGALKTVSVSTVQEIMRSGRYVCVPVCLSVTSIFQHVVTDFDEIYDKEG